MEKFIPYEKLSKKEQRKRNAQKRGSWYGINPVTRKPPNSRAYNRQKAGSWKKEIQGPASFFLRIFLNFW